MQSMLGVRYGGKDRLLCLLLVSETFVVRPQAVTPGLIYLGFNVENMLLLTDLIMSDLESV